ncbi:MAG: hypothetical protein A2X64_10450 [Ignavibacteria bacterium GWF2_33_9]|nr:MAG: hypothetical protein A2X64_10450 [Ignavibacteria bacterium GWF2_33_9]
MFNLGFENILSLNPFLVQTKSEIWRIFTFPFVDTSFMSIFVLGSTLYLFLPQLSRYFTIFQLSALLFLLILLQGAVQLLGFWGTNISFGGYSSISSFYLVLTILIFPKEKFRDSEFPRISNIQIILLLIAAYLFAGLGSIINGEPSAVIAYLFPMIFGTSIAFLTVLQIYLFRKYFLPKRQARSIAEIAELLSQARESMRQMEMVDETVSETGYQHKRVNEYSYSLSDDPSENENQLNEILDKISAKGQNSLTPDEIHFLSQISKNL